MPNLSESEKIEISASVNAELSKVWDYYTQPQHIVNWNFASEDWCCPWAENDLQKGGTYKARMEAKDGSFGFDFEGIYDEIVPKEKLLYHLEDGRMVETLFSKDNGTTNVITRFDPESQNPIEMQKNGWQAILNNFKNYTETN